MVNSESALSKKPEQNSGIPMAKRTTMHERPQSSKGTDSSTTAKPDQIPLNRKLGDKKGSVDGQNLKQIAKVISTPMASNPSRASRNSFKNVGLSAQQPTINTHASST